MPSPMLAFWPHPQGIGTGGQGEDEAGKIRRLWDDGGYALEGVWTIGTSQPPRTGLRQRRGGRVPINAGPLRDLRRDAFPPAARLGRCTGKGGHPHLTCDAGVLLEAATKRGAATRRRRIAYCSGPPTASKAPSHAAAWPANGTAGHKAPGPYPERAMGYRSRSKPHPARTMTKLGGWAQGKFRQGSSQRLRRARGWGRHG